MSDTNKKPRPPRHITPAGIAVFPRLTEPDFKFKKEHGEYSVKLRLPRDVAMKIIAAAEEVVEQSYRDQVAAHDGKKDKKGKPVEIKKADLSYQVELDDQQKETGNILIAFKANAGYTDAKTQEKKKLPIGLYDSKGKPTKVDIWGGSKIKVEYQIVPYFAPADLKAGASFRLLNVQVLDLVTKGMGGAGFKEEEGSFVAEEKESSGFEQGSADAKAKGDF